MKKLLAGLLAITFTLSACQPKEQAWSDPFTPEWAQNATVYEVNVRQYTQAGTFAAFESHLPRLKEMNVDVLWFMPIQPIGEMNRKGSLGSYYSIKDYTAINPEFGSLEDFKSVVNKAHELGMHVIIDWVANHTAWDHHWVTEHPEYYTADTAGNSPTVPFDGNGVPTDWTDVADLNYNEAGLHADMLAEMAWWIDECNIDGFRCDVASWVPHNFWQSAINSLRGKKDIFMLAEANEAYLLDVFNADYGWEHHHIMNEIAKGNKTVADLVAHGEKISKDYPTSAMKMYFTTNHDENTWNGTTEERMGDHHDALYALSMIWNKSIPLLYTGQEAGLDHRLPFFEKDSVGINWGSAPDREAFYTQLFKLKHDNPALWNASYGGTFEVVEVNEAANYIAVKRVNGNHEVWGYFNFGTTTVDIVSPSKLRKYTAITPEQFTFNGETLAPGYALLYK